MECCALGEGHDITAHRARICALRIATVDGVQCRRRHILHVNTNRVVHCTAMCALCIAAVRCDIVCRSCGCARDIQDIVRCRMTKMNPIGIDRRIIVTGVTAVDLMVGRNYCTVIGDLIKAETVQFEHNCARIKIRCRGGAGWRTCRISRCRFYLHLVDALDFGRIRILVMRKTQRIRRRHACAKFHERNLFIMPMNPFPRGNEGFPHVRFDVSPIHTNGCGRRRARNIAETRVREGEHRIAIFEIFTDDVCIRIKVANLLRGYTGRRDDQLISFDLITATVKGLLCRSCGRVTVVRTVDGGSSEIQRRQCTNRLFHSSKDNTVAIRK